MSEEKRSLKDLQQMQALPLKLKVRMTQQRIRDWINEYGEDGVYVSFSGGKDSTVLLTLVRQMYPNVKAVFVDTGLEYPEIRDFVRTWDNVDWVKPKMTFKQVIQKYGYPFISKEVAECVYGARRYLTSVLQQASIDQTDRQTDRQTGSIWGQQCTRKLFGTGEYAKPQKNGRQSDNESQIISGGGYENKYRKVRGLGLYSNGKNSQEQANMGSCQASRNVTNWGGPVKRFSDILGIRTIDNRIDSRLWKGYRQFADTTPDGNKHPDGQSDSGDYP